MSRNSKYRVSSFDFRFPRSNVQGKMRKLREEISTGYFFFIDDQFKKLKILYFLRIVYWNKTRIAISFFFLFSFFDLEMEFILISSLLPLDL